MVLFYRLSRPEDRVAEFNPPREESLLLWRVAFGA